MTTQFVVMALNGDPGHREAMFLCHTMTLAQACVEKLRKEQKLLAEAVRSNAWSDERTHKQLDRADRLHDESFRKSCAAAAEAWNKAGHLLEAHEWDFHGPRRWKAEQLDWKIEEIPVYVHKA
jgi:hypothetical protein